MDLFLDLEGHDPFGAGKPADVLRLPQDLGLAGELKDIPGVEVDEQKAAARVHLDVAQGGEHAVAGVIREQQEALVGDDNEPRLAAPVRHIDPAAPVVLALGEPARDEEGIGPGNQGRLGPVQLVSTVDRPLLPDGLDIVAEVVIPGLDVLRAVGKRLPHANVERPLARVANSPVYPKSAAGLEVEPERPDVRALDQRPVQRIAVDGPGPDFELEGIGGPGEAGRPGEG